VAARELHGRRPELSWRASAASWEPRSDEATLLAQRPTTMCGSVVARRDGDVVTWNPRFVQLRGQCAFHAKDPRGHREQVSVEGAVRPRKTGFWPARRFGSLEGLDDVNADWRDRIPLPRRHATGGFIVGERLEACAWAAPALLGQQGRGRERRRRRAGPSSWSESKLRVRRRRRGHRARYALGRCLDHQQGRAGAGRARLPRACSSYDVRVGRRVRRRLRGRGAERTR